MILEIRTMAGSALLLTIVGLSVGIPKCPMWREIAPCSCKMEKTISVTCLKNSTYDQIADKLRGHFTPENRVYLKIANANLNDLNYRTFKDLNMTIENLKLNHDIIGLPINEESFDGLTHVKYLSLADSVLNEVPEQLWKKMPNIAGLDLGRTQIHSLSSTSFHNLPSLESLVLPGNLISRMDSDSIPSHVKKLHLGRNLIRHLNDTLTDLADLHWLFVNANKLETLENQLPRIAPNLVMIHASNNNLEKLPQQLKSFPNLDSLFFTNNKISSFDGALSKSRKLVRLVLEDNRISTICEDDFAETEMLENLILSHNELTSLNNSLLNLRKLKFLNVTYNFLTEFSFQDVVGLEELGNIDLSHNQISKLIGPAAMFQNLVEWNIKLLELKLDHNLLESLNGALSGLPHLLRLNLSFNLLKTISPDDLIGLDQLQLLDLSYNQLTTLEEMSKTFLPKLSELKASHNYLTILEKDFHGLPVLCQADFEHNQIIALGRDLVAKTRCQIDNGVHEGTWDTLKINLQDNPILCDAALPEIISIMEINHTRIYGVTKTCLTLSEQPTTSKPNAFLGYIPEPTSPLPSVTPPNIDNKPIRLPIYAKPIPIKNNPTPEKTNSLPYVPDVQVELRRNEQYTVESDPQQPTNNHIAALALQKNDNELTLNNHSEVSEVVIPKIEDRNDNIPIEQPPPAVEIRLASQNKLVDLENVAQALPLEQLVLNKSILIDTTTEPPNQNAEEIRKP